MRRALVGVESYYSRSRDDSLIEIDSDGRKIWSSTFCRANLDLGPSVQPASDGGRILAGSTSALRLGGEGAWQILGAPS
jgi:hypothetical protein